MALALGAVLVALRAGAQVGGDRSEPVSADGGPLHAVSRPVSEGSGPVHDDGTQTVGETSLGPVRSGPVHDRGSRSMISGPVSEISRGPMTEPRPLDGGGAVAEASAGAVKHDIDRPLGERISQPLRELGPLQDRLRSMRLNPALSETEPVAEPSDLPSTESSFTGDGEADRDPIMDRDAGVADVAADELAPDAAADAAEREGGGVEDEDEGDDGDGTDVTGEDHP